MAQWFIGRPIAAWVCACLLLLLGGLAASRLGIEQYPDLAPPTIGVVASYPGASATDAERSITAVLEPEFNGLPDLLYFASESAQGQVEITLTFAPGTATQLAALEVQERIKRVEERLPESVRQEGITVNRGGASELLFVTLTADNPEVDPVWLGNVASQQLRPALLRIAGVGAADAYSPEYALRIWAQVDKLTAQNVSTAELVNALTGYNQRVTLGSLGSLPAPPNTALTAPLSVPGMPVEAEDFAAIPLRVNADGAALRVADVAQVEMGASDYSYPAFVDARPAAAIAVKLAPGANALATATAIKSTLAELNRRLPPGVKAHTVFDTSGYVRQALTMVGWTLLEALALVVLVMAVFLRSARATLIPTLVVPVALAGTCGVFWCLGYSLNVLTLFGLVLAIGLLVDDAIVVVERVERLMRDQGLTAPAATRLAMGQISGAIVAITLVLSAVFLPMAFFAGAMGAVYRQFAVALAVSMGFSAFLALSLTPALCATLLRPPNARPPIALSRARRHPFRRYRYFLDACLRRPRLALLLILGLYGAVTLGYARLPGGFVPNEDKGTFATVIQLPSGTPQNVTADAVAEVREYLAKQVAVAQTFTLLGFSYSGGQQNAGMLWPTLIDWRQRDAGQSVDAVIERLNRQFQAGTPRHPDARIEAFNSPPLPAFGRRAGLDLRLLDAGGLGHAALFAAKDRLLALASHEPALAQLSFTGQDDAPQLQVQIDRRKAQSMGVSVDSLNDTLSTLYGSRYVGDFVQDEQVRRIIVQASAADRQDLTGLTRAQVRNAAGAMVPLSAFVTLDWGVGPQALERFNGNPAVALTATPAEGYSSTQAMAAITHLVRQLPIGIDLAWAGQSYQEQLSGNQAPWLFGSALLIIFLCLAALYESLCIPLAVLLAIPPGLLGAVWASTARGLPDDLYFKVGLITLMGLTAKNAILIIDAARRRLQQGRPLREAILDAAQLRLRPILMTSLAFMFGVLPLALANGPGAASQQAIGTCVFGGMLVATVLTLVIVPVLFSQVWGMREKWVAWRGEGVDLDQQASESRVRRGGAYL